jgi:hypothetical protein
MRLIFSIALSLALTAFAGAVFAQGADTTMARVDSNLTDQSITQAGGSVDLMYIMLENPDISALQDFCIGSCDVQFRIAYYTDGAKVGEGLLQVTQVTPVRNDNEPRFTLEHDGIYMTATGRTAEQFFDELREDLRREPDHIFSSRLGS